MGGIAFPQVSAAVISGVGSIVVYAASRRGAANQAANNDNALGLISGLDVQFRPPQWNVGLPAQTMITIPAQYVQSQNAQQSSVGAVTTSNPSSSTPPNAVPQYLVFDAVLRVGHSQRATPTEHPIQDNANASDHIILRPAHLMFDVLMTDVLPAYAAGQWVGNASKSIACFQTLCNLRDSRIPLTVTTRLKTYQNMFIVDVIPEDTVKTMHGFRGTIEFQQLFLFSVATQTVSARSQTTASTSIGQTNPTPVPAGVVAQNGLPSTSTGVESSTEYQSRFGTMIGAGNWSSNNTGGLVTP